MGRVILLIASGLAIIGLVVWGLERIGLRDLPGNIQIESGHFKFYFPIVTCVVVSALLMGFLWLWNWLSHR